MLVPEEAVGSGLTVIGDECHIVTLGSQLMPNNLGEGLILLSDSHCRLLDVVNDVARQRLNAA